jgi:hypothetical protein
MESTAQYWKPVWAALERYWKPICQKREGARPMSGTLHLAALTVGIAMTLAMRVTGSPTHLHPVTVALSSLYSVGVGTWRAAHAIPCTFSPSRR